MTSTVWVNGVTLTDSDWQNDVDRLHYTIFADPANVSAAKLALVAGNRCASIYVYTAWDPSATGVFTNASSTSSATSTATDYITVANTSGTTTWTCVKAGVYRFTITGSNESLGVNTQVRLRATIGGTGTLLVTLVGSVITPIYSLAGQQETVSGTVTFYASMTAGQTVTVLPAVITVSGGAMTDFTTQCTVSAEYTGT